MKKLRILYLITDLGKGGAERYLINLCSELSKYPDLEFRIGTLFDNNQYRDLTEGFAIDSLYYKTFSILGKNENIPYQRLLKTFKPHIIHTHRFLAEFISAYYPDSNIKYVCHCHDNMEQFENFSVQTLLDRKKLLHYIEKRHLLKAKYDKVSTFFIANSTHTKNYFYNTLPDKLRNNIRLFYYGFNFDKFSFTRQRWVDVNVPIKILNVGSFQRKKNQLFCIDIAKVLKKKNISFEFNLIGTGELFNAVQQEVKQNDLENEVFLRGMINDIEEWYKTCNIYLHTAVYEPFGLVFLEAMAAGLPVISLDGKGNRDVIENGKTGFIIENENPLAFADAVEVLINNHELYSKISENSKKTASNYDIGIKTRELIDFYQKITTLI